MAIITTNLPPIAPLLRSWLSPCLGRTESRSHNDGTDKAQTEKPKYRNSIVRHASRASRKPQDLDNKAMAERYFSGFHNGQEDLDPVASEDNNIRMQAYPITQGNLSGHAAPKETADMEMGNPQRTMTLGQPVIPTERNRQAMGRRPSIEDMAQTVHEIV